MLADCAGAGKLPASKTPVSPGADAADTIESQ
jgi:hypothetical protein